SPNLILLDSERRVLSSFLPVTPQHGIGEYDVYAFPKTSDKISLEALLDPSFSAPDLTVDSLVTRVAGVGPVFAAEIGWRQRKNGSSLVDEIRSLIEQVRA